MTRSQQIIRDLQQESMRERREIGGDLTEIFMVGALEAILTRLDELEMKLDRLEENTK